VPLRPLGQATAVECSDGLTRVERCYGIDATASAVVTVGSIRPSRDPISSGRLGFANRKPWSGGTARFLEPSELLGELDPFGDDVEMQRTGELDDRVHEARSFGRVLGHPHHERSVDLQLVEREAPEVAEGGRAGAEVVDREPDTERLQVIELALGLLHVVQERPFGDIEGERSRVDLVKLERRSNLAHEIGLDELSR